VGGREGLLLSFPHQCLSSIHPLEATVLFSVHFLSIIFTSCNTLLILRHSQCSRTLISDERANSEIVYFVCPFKSVSWAFSQEKKMKKEVARPHMEYAMATSEWGSCACTSARTLAYDNVQSSVVVRFCYSLRPILFLNDLVQSCIKSETSKIGQRSRSYHNFVSMVRCLRYGFFYATSLYEALNPIIPSFYNFWYEYSSNLNKFKLLSGQNYGTGILSFKLDSTILEGMLLYMGRAIWLVGCKLVILHLPNIQEIVYC
jgi:hypothetical protein